MGSAGDRDVNGLEPAGRLVAPGLRLLPILHDRVESAAMVRAVLDATRPSAVAVELPASLRRAAERAVERLPRISAVISSGPVEEPLVWLVSPGDPLSEGMRWAAENGRRVLFVDPDLPYPARHRDRVPDPYTVFTLGIASYAELLGGGRFAATREDSLRERGVAYLLQQSMGELDGADVVCLLGAAHVDPVARLLAHEVAHPFARPRRPTVELRHVTPDSLTGVLPDPPLAHAVWELRRSGGPAPEKTAETLFGEAISRPVSIERHGLRLITGRGDGEEGRKQAVAELAARDSVRALAGTTAPDRRRLAATVWKVAAASYGAQTGEEVRHWQRRLFFDYARRQARLEGQLAAGLYEWVIAARGVGNDNLAWEVLDAAACYPWQAGPAEIESVRLDGEDLDLGNRKIRFRRRFLRTKRKLLPVRRRPRPEDPAEWLRGFDSTGLCSYPPEDLVVEDYGRFLQKKAIAILSGERSRCEPFTTSLLDGIDVKETLRNLGDGRVWVRENLRLPGDAGSVAVIFDPDPEDARFPFRMTWLGEHDQESDMAFYSTDPAAQVVGPGILRATYGGFLLTSPRGRLYDVWRDPDYRFAHTKAEVLAMAAVDYSEEVVVVHVADRAPAGWLKRYAAAQGKKLMHIPLASLSSTTYEKIRVLHLLAGRDKRKLAKDYIW